MEFTPLWSLIPTVAAFVVGLTALLAVRRYRWSDPEPLPAKEEAAVRVPGFSGDGTKFFFGAFVTTYRRELYLAGALLGLLIAILLSAPVQLTGEIAKEPGIPGRPFFFIHWQRNQLLLYYHETAAASNILTGLLALGLTIFGLIGHSPKKIKVSLLWSFMALAGSAQWMTSSEVQRPIGVVLYLVAGTGLLFWSLAGKKQISSAIAGTQQVPPHWEALLLTAVMALAAYGRLFALHYVPYGIEGDEAKWTAEVVSLGLRGEPDLNGMYHRDALPVSFYMQTLFHKVMGPSLFAARFEVAFFSVFATLVFYLLLRRITVMPLALLAAWLLSGSIFDISASRLANVESHVKLWPLLALALLAWALQKRHWTQYAASGVVLALGLLTYDTVWPLGFVMVLIAIMEAAREKETFGGAMRNIMALLTPALLSLPFLIPYLTGRLYYYELGNRGWEEGLTVFWRHFSEVMSSWYVRVHEDFIYNRNGPLLNAFLLPWLTFGFFALLATFNRRLSLWTLVWSFFFFFPVPIAANSPFGRVYYPALPAAYILAAAGLYIFVRESLHALGGDFKPPFVALSVAVLVWLPLFNLYIYFNEVHDYKDRMMRREAAELAQEAASPDNFIVLASVPRSNEALNNEYQMIELFMLEKLGVNGMKGAYTNVSLERVLPEMQKLSPRPKRSIFLDKTTDNDRQKRDALADGLRLCYPDSSWTEGKFFDRVDISSESLANPACISANLSIEQTSAAQFSWKLSAGEAEQIVAACATYTLAHISFEAENMNPGSGWQKETAFANDWNGNGFLMDNFGSQPTLFEFESKWDDSLVFIWVRYYKRAVDTSPGKITLNDRTYGFANVSFEEVNQWIWERVGPFKPAKGTRYFSLSRPYNDDPQQFMALFVDTVIVTPDDNFDPEVDNFIPLPAVSFSYPAGVKQGSISLHFTPGVYRCLVEAVNTHSLLVDAFGAAPVKSNAIEFIIEP